MAAQVIELHTKINSINIEYIKKDILMKNINKNIFTKHMNKFLTIIPLNFINMKI